MVTAFMLQDQAVVASSSEPVSKIVHQHCGFSSANSCKRGLSVAPLSRHHQTHAHVYIQLLTDRLLFRLRYRCICIGMLGRRGPVAHDLVEGAWQREIGLVWMIPATGKFTYIVWYWWCGQLLLSVGKVVWRWRMMICVRETTDSTGHAIHRFVGSFHCSSSGWMYTVNTSSTACMLF